MISIESKPFSSTEFYSGDYIVNDKKYDFTLEVNDDSSKVVTWMEEIPEGEENIERDIFRVFEGKL